MNVMQLVNRAANTRQTFPLMQQNTSDRVDFPFGNAEAIAAYLVSLGASVSNKDSHMMLVNNTAWVDVNGVVRAL
jgi:hypothetical protein